MRIWTKAPIAAATTLALALAVAGSLGVAPVGATPVVAAAPGAGSGTATSLGSDGRVDLIQATSSSGVALPRTLARSVTTPATIARAHVDSYSRTLAVDADTLGYQRTAATAAGDSIRFGQSIANVPVLGSGVTVSQTSAGAMQSINARTTPLSASTFPSVSSAASSRFRALAAKTVALREHRSDGAAALTISGATRYWYDPAVLGAPGADHALTAVASYQVTGPGLGYQVLVNVRTGTVALAWSTQERALNRVVCDLKNKAVDTLDPAKYRCNGKVAAYGRTEGKKASTVGDVNKVYTFFGDTAAAYKKYSNVDLTSMIGADFKDGKGKGVRGTVRVCNLDYEGGVKECPYRNAFWDGAQMVFGAGVVTDDITAHELTHGVTQATSGLQYVWQSGAINESMSDVFGEFTDLTNGSKDDTSANAWLIGEGSSLGVIRSLKHPADENQPGRMSSWRWDADEGFFDNGGVHTNSGVGNKAAYLITHGGSFYGTSVKGIGVTKAWKIYWGAQNMLPSGADYKDLAVTLPAACKNLIGKSGSSITSTDCTQVAKAVTATQMGQDPPRGAPASIQYCPTGTTRSTLHQEGFEKGTTWVASPGGSTSKPANNNRTWFQSQTSLMKATTLAAAVAGDGSYMYFPLDYGPSSGTLTQNSTWSIPKTTKGSVFLRFEHQFFFGAADESGAELLYSTNGGTTWLSATDTLPDKRGHNSKPSLLKGRHGFSGVSNGFGSSRFNMTALKGKSVKLRFGVKSAGGDAIWWVDNVQLYSCR